MSIKRTFFMDGKWVTIEPTNDPAHGNLLCMNTWGVDAKSGEPSHLIASVPFSRNQLFDLACGLLCATLDSEPEGVFDTSQALETNVHSLGYSENVADLMDKTDMEDPISAVTQTVAMFRRLDSRLPVLQACQRALEMCESEMDVNTLAAIAHRMERNLDISKSVQEIAQQPSTHHIERVTGTATTLAGEAGLVPLENAVVKAALDGQEQFDRNTISTWYRATTNHDSDLCRVLRKIQLFLAEFDDGTVQIRSDLTTPDREVTRCIFSPRGSFSDLAKFCSLAMPNFEKLYRDNLEVINAGEVPEPPNSMKLMTGATRGTDKLH